MRGGRFGAGQGLRALAALSVVAFHAAVMTAPSAGSATDGLGWQVIGHLDLGLYVFFVLSGYLLARGFAAALVTGSPHPRLGRYVGHRIRRIVPAFWAALVITLAVEGANGAGPADVARTFLFAGTWPGANPFQELIPQAWTLDVEMTFYLALPLAAALAALLSPRPRPSQPPRAGAAALLLALAAIVVASLVVRRLAGEVDTPLARSLPALAFAFAPGIALAIVEPLLVARSTPARWARPVGVLVPLAGVGLLVLAALHGRPGAVGGLLIGAGAGAIVAGPLVRQWGGGGTGALLGSPPLRWIGERS